MVISEKSEMINGTKTKGGEMNFGPEIQLDIKRYLAMQDYKPSVRDVVPYFKKYISKSGNSVGGSLHVVIGDCNIKDRDVVFCRDWALKHDDLDGYDLARILLKMSKTQRLKLASILNCG